MRFPGIAYSFMRGTDVAGPTALIVSRAFSVSTSAALLEFFFSELDKDRVLVLTNVSVVARPGTGQNVVEIAVQGVSQGELIFDISREEPRLSNDQETTLNWDGEVYIQGGGDSTDTVRVFVLFNSPTNANTMTVGLHGIVIPRGNLGGF